MRLTAVLLVLVSAALVPSLDARVATVDQVELDRTLVRVYGTPIMASDARQVRLLRLLTGVGDSDEAIQTALENRLLMLREVARGAITEPSAVVTTSRRQSWAASWPPGTDLPALMARARMSDRVLNGWFRDKLHIEAYLDQRFGQADDARRSARVADWVRDLRIRDSLPVK